LLLVIVTFYAVLGLQKIIRFSTHQFLLKSQKEDKEVDPATIELPSKIANAALWVIAIILVLANLGYDVSALLAGLGIGGIAIAFALQNVLGDIFASFSIYLDKPFEIGDFIIIGDDLGVVKKIGIKTTRIQALQGQEIVISNKELTNSRINNYKKMKKRRIAYKIGVTYDTPTSKLKKVPGIVKKIMDKHKKLVTFDRAHFKDMGDFNLIFEIVYYLASSDYAVYMDTQQALNLDLMDAFKKEKISFAFPTQTVYVGKA
jgi:small-conductance mechanosensitive channel